MRIIAVTNQKGGVGKTTTTVNLAGGLSDLGKKVVLIDMDPQAHLTTSFGVNPDETPLSCYELLTESQPLDAALVQIRPNLKLLSSGLNLAAAEQELISVVGRETILRDAIADYRHECDYILIDCPPSLGMLTLNALAASKELFIPVQPHFLSLQGLSQLLESILVVQKRINPDLCVSGLLFCMFDRRLSLTSEIVSDIEEFFKNQRDHQCPWQAIRIFNSRIRRNVKLAESPSYGQTIFEYDKQSIGAEDYGRLIQEIIEMAPSKSAENTKDAIPSEPSTEDATPREQSETGTVINPPQTVFPNDSETPPACDPPEAQPLY